MRYLEYSRYTHKNCSYSISTQSYSAIGQIQARDWIAALYLPHTSLARAFASELPTSLNPKVAYRELQVRQSQLHHPQGNIRLILLHPAIASSRIQNASSTSISIIKPKSASSANAFPSRDTKPSLLRKLALRKRPRSHSTAPSAPRATLA